MQSKNVKADSSPAQHSTAYVWMDDQNVVKSVNDKVDYTTRIHTGFDVGRRWVTSSSAQSTVSRRSLPPANPLPAVWPPWAPSRHRHSPPRQRPILVAGLHCLSQPFVPYRRVVAEGRSHPSANLAFPLLPSLCRQLFVIFTSAPFVRHSVSQPLGLQTVVTQI